MVQIAEEGVYVMIEVVVAADAVESRLVGALISPVAVATVVVAAVIQALVVVVAVVVAAVVVTVVVAAVVVGAVVVVAAVVVTATWVQSKLETALVVVNDASKSLASISTVVILLIDVDGRSVIGCRYWL